MTTVTLLTRPGCHLCEPAREVVARVCHQLSVPWQEQSVDSDQQWVLRYGDLVPVLMVNGRMCGFWRLVESEVEQEVRAAVGATEGADPPPSSNSL